MPKLDYTFSRDYVFLGTTADRARVLVSGHLYRQPVSRDVTTVHHETVNNPETLSVSAVAFTGRMNIGRNLANGLHSIGFFGPKIVAPAPGFTLAEVRDLVDLGTYWHCNTFRPACAHMAEPTGSTPREKLDAGVTCPITGAKWGYHYAEPLPDDVRSCFIELMEKGATEDTDY